MLQIIRTYSQFVWICCTAVFLLTNADDLRNVTSVVGFTAWAQFPQTYESGEIVLFDGISVNEGEFYSESTGVFVCPIDGVYFINLNARRNDADGSGATSLAVFKDSKTVLALSENDPSSDGNTVSSSTLVDCLQGDFIFVEGTGSGTLFGEVGKPVSTFSVFMVTPHSSVITKEASSPVLFNENFDGYSGYLTQDASYKAGDLLLLNGTVYNSSSYDPATGNFTCAQTGIYYISLNPQKRAADDLAIGLSKDTIVQLYLEETTGESNGYNSISNSGLISCERGSKLSVKATQNGSAHEIFTSVTIMLVYSQEDNNNPFIGFTAFKQSIQEYGSDDRITFDGIILNEGGGYNVLRSSFICPTYGLYFVSINIQRHQDDPLDLKVQLETVTLFRVIDKYGENESNTISNSGLFYCQEEQEVWVSGVSDGSVYGNAPKSVTTFTILRVADFSKEDIWHFLH